MSEEKEKLSDPKEGPSREELEKILGTGSC